MDSQKKSPTHLNLPMSQWLSHTRADDTPVAWRKGKEWHLHDLRQDVLHLIGVINATAHARWALCFEDTYAFVVAMLAVLYCGRVPVLPGHHRQAVLREQLGEFDAILTDQSLVLPCPILHFPFATLPAQAFQSQELPSWREGLSLVLFTSGSTGTPQKIVKSVESLTRESRWLAERWGETPAKARLAATVAHHHMYGLTFGVVMPLSSGLPFYSGHLAYHEQLVDLARHSPLILISSPAFLQRLDPGLGALHCTRIYSAGGPLSFADAQQTRRLCGVLPTEIYGTTETGVVAHRQQALHSQSWELFPGAGLVADKDDNLSLVSELIPQSEGILLHDNLDVLPGGRRFHLGTRKDRIVKIAEQRISLTDIEQRLCGLDNLIDASVLTLCKQNRQYIAALIVLSEQGSQQLQAHGQTPFLALLRQELRQWLPVVAIPRYWRIVAVVPINRQGKRAYAQIQEMFL